MKIEIGKQYKVHGTEEDGNVIKITEKKNGLCRYETISERNRSWISLNVILCLQGC